MPNSKKLLYICSSNKDIIRLGLNIRIFWCDCSSLLIIDKHSR